MAVLYYLRFLISVCIYVSHLCRKSSMNKKVGTSWFALEQGQGNQLKYLQKW